ncbi:hypothetical protein D6D01_06273 [Aureobasidium pullulans]|uniref:Uncharacterized protein n=1 Tax=Aureobasidium pullulans TaxID=5580 RepID=A0A4S9L2X4_AURPU|nr:hypothetical protein D6D01_06273 [Aureobasidium pullulans]
MLSLLKAAIEAEAATCAANAGTTTAPPVPDPEEAQRRQDLVRGMRTLAAPTKEEQAATTAAGPPLSLRRNSYPGALPSQNKK